MPLSPIALFAYNRPRHTLGLLHSLRANPVAAQSKLFVFCDGPAAGASPDEIQRMEAVRKLVRSEKWCGEVIVVEQDTNAGLADSIVRGVTRLTSEFGKVIVLEDDLALSPGFLDYSNRALDLYEHQENVMCVTGYMYPQVRIPFAQPLPDTFFSRHMNCWGWSTWKRAWQHYSGSAEDLLSRLQQGSGATHFNLDIPSGNFLGQLEANVNGTLRTWAVKWGASIYLQGGLCLYPGNSLVKNMGTDGTGTHRDLANIFLAQQLYPAAKVAPIALQEDPGGRKAIIYFVKFLMRQKTLLDKVLEKSRLLR